MELPIIWMRCKAPISNKWDQNSLPIAGGVGVPMGLMLSPAPMQPLGVLGILAASMRISSHGSSFRSRTIFLKKIGLAETSMTCRPARSISPAMGSIMP